MRLEQPLTKLYYSIGEIAEIFGVNTSLIRYWEKEFKNLKPNKNRNGIRKYTTKDIAEFNKIYELVKERGFTIEGARKALSDKSTVIEQPIIQEKPTIEKPKSHTVVGNTEEKKVVLNRLSLLKGKLLLIKQMLNEA